MADRRKTERRETSGARMLSVSIRTEGKSPIDAYVLDSSEDGLSALTSSGHGLDLAPGTEVELVLKIREQEHAFPSVVRHAALVRGVARYGFEFRTRAEEERLASPLMLRIFDRRVSQRVVLDPGERVQAVLRDEEHGLTINGVLLDVSSGDASLEVALEDSLSLSETERVLVEFRLPGRRHLLRLPASLPHRRNVGATALLALEFDPEGSRILGFTRDELLDFVAERVARTRRAG